MRIAFVTGIIGGVVSGSLHLLALTVATDMQGGIFYYSPLLIFFACIYFSIRRTSSTKYEGNISFKDALKVGGVTSVLMAFIIGIFFFIALTHTDTKGLLAYMIEQKMTVAQMNEKLSFVTKQNMVERAKYYSIPYFLLGFMMTVGVAAVLRRTRMKKTA